jgi:hypothetical protein
MKKKKLYIVHELELTYFCGFKTSKMSKPRELVLVLKEKIFKLDNNGEIIKK